MMLACPELRVVPVTIHLALRAGDRAAVDRGDRPCRAGDARGAAAAISAIAAPVLAVAGLNPHAGEGGALGREDIDIVAPAVAALRAAGIDARGPLAADTMFHAAARRGYDAALCMYHDQALIPIKTLDFDGGGQRDARAAVHPHLARSRHRLRHRRQRRRPARQPDRRAAAGRRDGGAARRAPDTEPRADPIGLPPLREVIARHGIAARRSLGQNFLLDLNLTRRIARAAGRARRRARSSRSAPARAG